MNVASATEIPVTEKLRTPRRVLHFSDGTLEEYSTDEDEDQTDQSSVQQLVVDTVRSPSNASNL